MHSSPNAAASGSFILGGDLTVNRLGFGAMHLTGPYIWDQPANKEEAIALLRRAVELGVNLIDTADSYGPEVSENLIAEALHPYPKGLVIATKGGLVRPTKKEWLPLGRPEYLMQCIEMSLRRLKLDCIDLYQFHAPDPQVPLEDSLKALRVMQKQGKIRHIGLSNVSVNELERARKIVDVVSVQNHYNLLNKRSEEVLKHCESLGIGFIPWYPLASGKLAEAEGAIKTLAQEKGATPSQIALAWLLKRSKVMLPIPGTSSITHLEENIHAASISLTDSEYSQLDATR